MDFKDQIKVLGERVTKLKENLQTEEATKTALIMPFLQALGYDIFDPTEVIPEYTCDLGIKKGEKIDYAICRDGAPTILIECKHWRENLNAHNSQLFRYFHVSKARFGILTNGVVYRFYTDLVEKNKMDEKPFFEFNMEQYRSSQVEKLKEFHKSYFDVDIILNTASELKYTNEIRNAIAKEVAEPSDDFVKYFARPVYSGRFNEAIMEQFRAIVKAAFAQYSNDYMNDRLKSAIGADAVVTSTPAPSPESKAEPTVEEAEVETPKVFTTDEETQGYYIVRAICYNAIDNIDRIACRDTQSYFGILLDDNNRKPICRLHFNSSNKYIETFDAEKKGSRHLIDTLADIYKYQAEIIAALKMYQ